MGFTSKPALEFKTGFREPPVFSDREMLQALTLEMVAQKGSDVYFMSGHPVMVKINGDLQAVTQRRLTTEECLQVINFAAGNDKAAGMVAQGKEVRSSYNAIHPSERDRRGEKQRYRFRCNAIGGEFRNSIGVQLVMRSINSEPPNIAGLGIEEEIVNACTPDDGIVYITGATGSGKSTTFAAMLRHILEGDTPIKGNIVTLESPIEYVFENVDSDHSVVFQCEVGRGVESFDQGIISFMRHDPSLIVVGETRDQETASAATAAANTGHPVYTTVHANNVAGIFSRLLSFYEPAVRDSMLFSIVDSARLLINQRLVPSLDGRRTALREYLVLDEDLREQIIHASDPRRITGVMRELLHSKGKSMAQAAQEAFEKGLISEYVMRANQRV